jgi:hypothetical protein
MNGFRGAWHAWYFHRDCSLWGHPLWYWGRWGKVAELAAALSIVVEIIGPENINNYATHLQEMIDGFVEDKELTTLRGVTRAVLMYPTRVLTPGTLAPDEYRSAVGCVGCANIFVGWAITGLAAHRIVHIVEHSAPGFWANIVEALAFGLLAVLASLLFVPIVTILAPAFLRFAARPANHLILHPVARVLKHPQLKRIAQVVSVVLLLAGFYFDLLGS